MDCGTSGWPALSPGDGAYPSPCLPSFGMMLSSVISDTITSFTSSGGVTPLFSGQPTPPLPPALPSSLPLPSLQVVLLAEYFNLVMHNFVYYLEGEIWGEAGPPPPLKDLGIMLFAGVFPPSAQWVVGLSLYLLIGMVLSLCFGRLLLNNVPWGGPQTMLIKEREDGEDVATCLIPVPFVYLCKRACQVLSIALVLRVTSYILTLEPNPAPYCHPPYWDPPNTIGEIMGRVEITGSCGDLLFSSHTLHSMVMLLTVLRHAPRLYVVCGISVCSMVLVIIVLLAFKNHYSHDIVTGERARAFSSLSPFLPPSFHSSGSLFPCMRERNRPPVP